MFGQQQEMGASGMPPAGMPAAPPMGPQGPGAAPPMGGGILEALAALMAGGGQQDGLASLSPPDPSETTGDSLASRLGGIMGDGGGMPGMPGEEAGEMDPIMMALLMGGGGQGGPPGAPPMPPARPPAPMGGRPAPM